MQRDQHHPGDLPIKARKRKNAQTALPQLDFTSRMPQHGDLVMRKDSASTYQIIHVNHGCQTVILCLMHGGSQSNFELRNIPVENLIWVNE